MEFLLGIVDIFLHLDKHLTEIISEYGTLTYAILFCIIFVETGLVVMPFLPGDSLLFAAGALASLDASPLNVWWLACLLFVAAVFGDTLNYSIGKSIGPRVFNINSRWIKKEHLLKTQNYYETHGGKTIIFARFIPIIRTFAPFVAGVGTMKYSKFILFNVVGGFLWVFSFLLLGYFIGENPIVKKNFTLVIFIIIFISILPPMIEFIKAKMKKEK